jgi:hypothetical protein
MRPKHSGQPKASAERVVKDIRQATRQHFSAEDKIRIVLEGLRGEALAGVIHMRTIIEQQVGNFAVQPWFISGTKEGDASVHCNLLPQER